MYNNKKIWANGDLITKERMNNIEDGIYNAHEEINTLKNNTSTGGSNINDTSASATTTYSSNKIESIKEELSSRISAIGGSGIIFENIEVDEIFTSVEEVIECTGITLSANTLSFTTTNNQTLSAVISPTDCTGVVVWSVEPVGVVTVNNGVITPIKNGTATITVTCGSQSATCNVTVS